MLEVCCYNIQSCLAAQNNGAGRIELCSDASAGGITPSIGLVKYVLREIAIPTYVMVRPRGAHFVYDEYELSIMEADIIALKEIGCKGIVLGILTPDNKIDIATTARLVSLAYPMGVTFHKAFDRTENAIESLEAVIATGCERILTSGLAIDAISGISTIQELIKVADNRITIMPGGGVRSENIATLMNSTNAKEYHSSCITNPSPFYLSNPEEIQAISEILAKK